MVERIKDDKHLQEVKERHKEFLILVFYADFSSSAKRALVELENFSNKMKAFYDFDFKSLISELNKKKIKLSLSQQDKWEEYFNNFKTEINELQKQIDKTDKEIDQMVYELYDLTKEEIEIVEKG